MSDALPSLLQDVSPVEKCGACDADKSFIYWNPTGGWSCRKCGESDYPEAAE
jgi:hypothetical protein